MIKCCSMKRCSELWDFVFFFPVSRVKTKGCSENSLPDFLEKNCPFAAAFLRSRRSSLLSIKETPKLRRKSDFYFQFNELLCAFPFDILVYRSVLKTDHLRELMQTKIEPLRNKRTFIELSIQKVLFYIFSFIVQDMSSFWLNNLIDWIKC